MIDHFVYHINSLYKILMSYVIFFKFFLHFSKKVLSYIKEKNKVPTGVHFSTLAPVLSFRKSQTPVRIPAFFVPLRNLPRLFVL